MSEFIIKDEDLTSLKSKVVVLTGMYAFASEASIRGTSVRTLNLRYRTANVIFHQKVVLQESV